MCQVCIVSQVQEFTGIQQGCESDSAFSLVFLVLILRARFFALVSLLEKPILLLL